MTVIADPNSTDKATIVHWRAIKVGETLIETLGVIRFETLNWSAAVVIATETVDARAMANEDHTSESVAIFKPLCCPRRLASAA